LHGLKGGRSPQLQGLGRLDIVVVIKKDSGWRFASDFAIDYGVFTSRDRENLGAYPILTHHLRQKLNHLRHAHSLGADTGLAAKPHQVLNPFLPVVVYIVINILHRASRYVTEIYFLRQIQSQKELLKYFNPLCPPLFGDFVSWGTPPSA
jgi:hypothetical protein